MMTNSPKLGVFYKMLRALLSLFLTVFIFSSAAFAQSSRNDVVWVQLEAQPSLTVAGERIRGYADRMQDINGFSLGGGWYAIALGPYLREDAESVLQVYRSEGLIPIDSYLTTSGTYRNQFWPVGANLLGGATTPTAPNTDTASALGSETASQQITESDETIAEVITEPEPQIIDETVSQARASEAQLSREERMKLQEWLKWAGYYDAAIDGAFGRGTRGSMGAWQRNNGFDETGVLTTLQRQTLRDQYFAVLEGMNLQRVTDLDAGVEMIVPMGVVAKTATDYPFVQFDATGDIAAKVLMISQAGDQTTLFGLYDIMQTLEVVPLEGERSRRNSSFLLTGANANIVSHTEVTLQDGQIKGFTLVWPAGDEERRTRILGEMQSSFSRLSGVLDPAAGSNARQEIDLISGLQVRSPKLSRSGFFIDASGHVITTVEAVASCEQITLEEDYPAEIAVVDDALGVAILRPAKTLAPMGIASLRLGAPRIKSEVAVSGYSYEGALGAPTMTFGQLADIKGLAGEQELTRLALAPQAGDAGGPVLDTAGAVFGMLLPRDAANAQQLPGDVNFAVNSDAIRALLQQEGIQVSTSQAETALAPEDLTTMAGGMTVLVSCW